MHGGETPEGIASPNFRHGRARRRRDLLPIRLHDSLDASLSDPEQLSLKIDLATLDARIDDLCERVDIGECGETWTALLEASQELGAARERANRVVKTGDKNRIDEAAREIEQMVESLLDLCRAGASDYAAWREIISLIALRAKLTEIDIKRRAAMKTDVPIEIVAEMIARFEASVNTHVADPEALKGVAADLRLIAGDVRGSN